MDPKTGGLAKEDPIGENLSDFLIFMFVNINYNYKIFMENKTNELKAKSLKLDEMINYQDGSVVSREILKLPAGTLTVFAFDAGQGLSEHTAPFDATVYILDGEAEVKISGQIHLVKKAK